MDRFWDFSELALVYKHQAKIYEMEARSASSTTSIQHKQYDAWKQKHIFSKSFKSLILHTYCTLHYMTNILVWGGFHGLFQ